MPIVDIPTMRLDTALDTPKGFQVTPGFADIEKGSNTPPRENWASTLDSPLLSTVAGATSALGAAFRRDNLIGSALSAEDRRPGEWDYSYKPYDDIKGTEYEQHSDRFLDARNANHARSIKRQIDQEVEDVKTLGAMPWYQSVPVELLAGGFDLPTLMPAGAFVRSVKGGFSVARTAVSVGTMAGVSSTTQEAGLHAIQETRTVEESAVNIGASVLLGSLIGAGGAKLLSNVEWNEGVRALDRIVAKEPVPDAKVTTSHPSSIGAAALEPHTLDETAVAGAVAGGLARATRPLNPAMRISQSPNSATREVGSNLFEMSTYMRGNEDGFASPVSAETLRKEWDGGLMLAVQATRNNYSSYRKAGGNLSRSEFESEIGKAMRRGDEHAIPEVAAAAKSWRSNVIEPLKEVAIKAKLLPEDVSVETATSYFSRMWKRGQLIADEPVFKKVVRDWVGRNIPRWREAFDAETSKKSAKLKNEKLTEYLADRRLERDARFGDDLATRSMSDDIANEVFNKLTGRASEGTRPEFITITSRGPLKERTFNIPDELVERWLESDVGLVGRRYQRVMSSDVELANKFGTPDMKDALQKVRDGYDKLRKGVTDPKELTRFANAEKSDLRDLEGVRDIIRGIYGQSGVDADYGYIFRIANSLQYIFKMGQVVLSSLTEPVRVVAAKGLLPFMRDGFNGLSNIHALGLSIEEARLAGNINDKILAHRLSTLADLTDFYGSRGPVEKFMDNATNVASSWNGIRMWTDAGKMLASTMIQNQILKGVTNFAKLSAKERRYLAFVGIDESMATRIAKQFSDHGEEIGGVNVARTTAWTDDVAKRTYRAALNKDLDSMIVTKGAGDVPLFANTPFGRLILQFNTFNLASHQRILMRGLQEGHARFLGTVMALSTMGMLQTYLAAVANNRTNKLPSMAENPGWWIAEGLDRSGLFSVPIQIANGVEKLTGINPIKAPMKMGDVGQTGSQRIANRNELGVLGPTAGTIHDIGTVASAPKNIMAGEDITQGQKNAAERLIPFNSYYGMRQFLKYILNPPVN